jgi:hypothetical protein
MKTFRFTAVLAALLLVASSAIAAESADSSKPQVKEKIKAQPDALDQVKGLFLEANPGVLVGFGGNVSAEPWFTAQLGYNFNKSWALGLNLGFSAVTHKISGTDIKDDYLFGEVGIQGTYYLKVADRLQMPFKLYAAIALINNREGGALGYGPDVGAAVGILYLTWQKHLQFGVDVAFHCLINQGKDSAMQTAWQITPAVAVYPTIKYNF